MADDAGLTLIQLAIALVLRHPAVTAPIIGPRTMDHLESHLAAADVVLGEEMLDRIDEVVPPGVTINPAENGWVSHRCNLRPGAADIGGPGCPEAPDPPTHRPRN